MWSWLGPVLAASAALVWVVLLFRRDLLGSVLRWLTLATVVAVATGGGLLWLLGWPSLPPAERFTTADLLELLKIALAVVAGLGGVVLLAANLRRQRVTEAEHELAKARDDREREHSYNERFGAAAEQLAHESPAVKLAGLYAMAGLADVWESNRQVCVDVVCGYLRSLGSRPDGGEGQVWDAAMTAIRRKLRADGEWPNVSIDLSGVHFVDADFTGLATTGDVTLDGATFTGRRTSFEDCRFTGGFSVTEARFDSEFTTFESAVLGGGERATRANLEDVVFGGQRLSFDFARLASGTSFAYTRFASAFVSFRATAFTGEVSFEGTSFSPIYTSFHLARWEDGRTRFAEAEFSGEKLEFTETTVQNADLTFTDCLFSGVHVNFEDTLLRSRSLKFLQCEFEDCSLDFQLAHEHPTFGTIHLSHLDIERSTLRRCRIDFRRMRGPASARWEHTLARIRGGLFEEVEIVRDEDSVFSLFPWVRLAGVRLVNTVFPDELVRGLRFVEETVSANRSDGVSG
ncbi:pentapeptide repeat-containing protein [Saccharomonospora cyanea]|uniref:Low-complexity protein n=1 Tax=Saccharomonospora cyanea NA-134 TaxID=882082 RepID=H5XRF2_9PSEU|nr:hypothetical protein [Saccharomonospora cyanea]EHR63897.1 hypothetical protein SaccyDRAFT_5103 [Saccharomonospora cyanea NA-134]